MKYTLEITDRARDDADAAFAWMAENISASFAEQWYQGLFTHLETLTRYPTRFAVAPESLKFPEKIQELVYGKTRHKHKYRILYTVRDHVVVILYIHHSSRKEPEP